ncbi:MAG: YkuJ family protein [Bacillota bacterium]
MSLLVGIVKRLNDLKETSEAGNEPAQRFFEVNGEKVCSVKFFDKTNTYELEVFIKGENPQTYQFDNIDMIAIEIFDLIH